MFSLLIYWNFSFNELLNSKITNGELPPPFMTFNVCYDIANKYDKRGTIQLSRRLIPLNEVFDK